MRYGTTLSIVLALVLLMGASGCEEKKTAGDPPVRLGLGPGETAAADPAPPPVPPEAEYAPSDVTVETNPPPAETTTPVVAVAPPSEPAVQRLYTIKKGDTLIGLARRYYNDPARWKDIWNANRQRIPNPNLVMPGLEIALP